MSSIDKNSLRIKMLDQRQRVGASEAVEAGQKIAYLLSHMIPRHAIVAGYCTMRGELDISVALSHLALAGNTLCLPVIEDADKPLYFRKWAPGEPLAQGRYGIDIPVANAPISKPDILLVPLVAFDRAGNRLGYGAGYYDRTIERLRATSGGVHVLGVGYGFQEVPLMTPEPHDQKLDSIITEKEVIHTP